MRQTILFSLALIFALPLTSGQATETQFRKKKEKISGSFRIISRGEKRLLTFSGDFKTRSGPDLQVVFSPLPFDEANGKNAMDGAVTVGLLSSNKGAQEYEIPASLDLSTMKSLLIHCVKYTRLWGGAGLPR